MGSKAMPTILVPRRTEKPLPQIRKSISVSHHRGDLEPLERLAKPKHMT
jgi:hypothetical protein